MDQLDKFTLTKILQSNPETKESVLLGLIDNSPCILKLKRLALPELTPGSHLPLTTSTKLDQNDIYSWGTGLLKEDGTVYLDVVYPATEAHIAKYTESPKHVVVESGLTYLSKVKPYVETQRKSQIDWVRGILFNNVEADRVLFRNDDFILLPNSKWDRKNVDTLYLLALAGPAKTEIASIRELTSEHITFLKELKEKALEICEQNWGLPNSQVKLYFHYHPSYYHLHVHITNISVQQASDFGRCILLEQVISMLEIKPMEKWDLTYILSENSKLYPLVSEK